MGIRVEAVMLPDFLLLAVACLFFACAVYVLGRAAGIPYELKTDRLWKLGEEEVEPDDPEREDNPAESAVVDLRSRRAIKS